jgi:hypothetical protein
MKVVAAGCVSCACALLVGCASAPREMPSQERLQAAVQRSDSAFDSLVGFKGPSISYTISRGTSTTDYIAWFVRAWRDKRTGAVARQLYVSVENGESWRYYRSASFEGGALAVATSLRASPRCGRYGCQFDEHMAVDLTEGQWTQALVQGLAVRLNAQGVSGREIVIEIPYAYAQALQEAMKR